MTAADDSHWEPDGVTLQVRFCEGRAVRSNSNVRRDYSPERAFFSAPTDSADQPQTTEPGGDGQPRRSLSDRAREMRDRKHAEAALS
jgi:hypothetical protein